MKGGENMLEVFYEDRELIVVKKPAGTESQARNSFEPDMVSEIRNHICHNLSPSYAEPYVGVVHRLDKPVEGIMVYAKTKSAAAGLSSQIQAGRMQKTYRAVVCGRCVDNVGNFVDYLLKDPRENVSKIVKKGINGAKRAELRYRVLGVLEEDVPAWAGPGPLTLVEIGLLTGRHHQIRVQFAGRGLPLWGDARYGAQAGSSDPAGRAEAFGSRSQNVPRRTSRRLALCACGLVFTHPVTKETMTFSMKPDQPVFTLFGDAGQQDPKET